MKFKGPVDISICFANGDYCNSQLEIGVSNEEVLEAFERCDEIIAMSDPEEGITIGWADAADEKSGSISYPSFFSPKEEIIKVIKAFREFIS